MWTGPSMGLLGRAKPGGGGRGAADGGGSLREVEKLLRLRIVHSRAFGGFRCVFGRFLLSHHCPLPPSPGQDLLLQGRGRKGGGRGMRGYGENMEGKQESGWRGRWHGRFMRGFQPPLPSKLIGSLRGAEGPLESLASKLESSRTLPKAFVTGL